MLFSLKSLVIVTDVQAGGQVVPGTAQLEDPPTFFKSIGNSWLRFRATGHEELTQPRLKNDRGTVHLQPQGRGPDLSGLSRRHRPQRRRRLSSQRHPRQAASSVAGHQHRQDLLLPHQEVQHLAGRRELFGFESFFQLNFLFLKGFCFSESCQLLNMSDLFMASLPD